MQKRNSNKDWQHHKAEFVTGKTDEQKADLLDPAEYHCMHLSSYFSRRYSKGI